MFQDFLAFDFQSVRRPDKDGHLHVTVANISKATVNPYLGREIPRWKELGLQPDKIYRLLRAPDELKKAAGTFAGKPLLIMHKPLAADEHPYEKVVGSVGTDVTFDGTYLKAPLTIWPDDAIDMVESGKKKELSCGYRYDADMRPGTYNGQAYDGIMRNIVGNHVALVAEGRAGPDCVVGDSNQEIRNMNKPMTRKGAMAFGAVTGFLAPRLAEGASVNLAPIFSKVNARNYAASIPTLVAEVSREADGKLVAMDGMSDGLVALLGALSKVEPAEAPAAPGAPAPDAAPEMPETPPSAAAAAPEASAGADPMSGEGGGEGEGGMEQVKAFLQSKLDPADFAQLEQMLAALGGGEEEQPGAEGEGESAESMGTEDSPPDFPGRPKIPGVEDKRMGAMDAAVNKAVEVAVAAERIAQKNLRDAERFAKQFVGELIGCDSAEVVYRKALKIKGVDADSVKEVPALKLILSQTAKKTALAQPSMATDAAGVKGFFERFPGAERIHLA